MLYFKWRMKARRFLIVMKSARFPPQWRSLVLATTAMWAVSCFHPNPAGPVNRDTNSGITATPLDHTVYYDAVYVVNGGDNSISVINAQTDSVTGVVLLDGAMYPHHIYLSPDRSKLSISMPGMDFSEGHHGGMAGMKGAVVLLDALSGQLVLARTTASMNHNAIFSPDGNEIWTSGMTDSGMVYVMNSITLGLVDSMRAGNSPQEVSFDKGGRYAFVCNGVSNSVSVFNRMTRAHIKDIAVDSDPVGAWMGDNGMMYVDNEESKTICAIDTASLSVHHRYTLGFTPGMVATGPGSSLWITDSENGKVIINMADTDMKMGEITAGAGAHGIVFSADKTKFYITNQSAKTVSVINVSTELVLRTIPVGSKPNGLAWRKN
jgi:YVTN family beta-propeller protein